MSYKKPHTEISKIGWTVVKHNEESEKQPGIPFLPHRTTKVKLKATRIVSERRGVSRLLVGSRLGLSSNFGKAPSSFASDKIPKFMHRPLVKIITGFDLLQRVQTENSQQLWS